MVSRLFTIQAARNDLAAFNNSVHVASEGSFAFPSTDNFYMDNSTNFVDTQFRTYVTNPFIWDVSATLLSPSSPVLSMNIYDSKGQDIIVSDLTEPIRLQIATGAANENTVRVTPYLTAVLFYHAIEPDWNSTQALSIVLTPDGTNETFELFLKHGSLPTPTDYDLYYRFPEDGYAGSAETRYPEYKIFIRNESVTANDTEVLYLGLRLYVNESALEPDYSDYYQDPDTVTVKNESLPPYSITFYGSSCRFWDEIREMWATDGCEVSEESTAATTHCLCTHLTSFGTGVFVAPNQIHFDTVFDNLDAKIADNYAVVIALSVVYFLYFVGLVWARRMDRKDMEKWGATPLADNVMSDTYFYRMTVFTGLRKGAGTRSKVSFVLSGDNGDTGVRQLADEKGKKTMSRGTINQFVLGVPECLGPLSYLRIWHDNSGKGAHQSWYLGKVIITDLQQGSSYIFLCNRWLAVEEDDGSVDRILPVAGREDLVDFQHLFFTETQRSLRDSHLWISVFSRPNRSNFSRVQRLSCITCLLLATMMADAMFYQTGGGAASQSGALAIGPVKVTMQEIYVSIVSSLIILPLNLIVDQIFRRSKSKSRKTDTAFMDPVGTQTTPGSGSSQQQDENIQAIRSRIFQVTDCPDVSRCFEDEDLKKSDSQSNPAVLGIEGQEPDSGTATKAGKKRGKDSSSNKTENKAAVSRVPGNRSSVKRKRGRKVLLPHWCVYIGWVLVVTMSGVSTFITFSYSMEWGREKSIAWLTAMLMSVFQSIMLVQPFKIIVLALVMAWACKKPKEEEEEEEEEEGAIVDASQIQLKADEEPVDCTPKMAFRPHLAAPAPNSMVLASSREERLKEIETGRVTREIIAYVTYLLLLILVSGHNLDSRSFLWTSSIRKILNTGPAVSQVHNVKQFWNWTERVVVPNLYAEADYRGYPLPDGGSRIISTMAAYRVGPVRLRQHRVIRDPCKITSPFSHDIISCTQTWSWDTQETGTFLEGWTTAPDDFVPGVNFPWFYRDWTETEGIPYVGIVNIYPAGGYVKDLIGNRERVELFLEELEDFQWVDQFTRSIFVEFVLYNPNVNLFAMVTVIFESPMTGNLQGEVLVHSFRLFSHLGGYGVFVALCEALVILWTIYFLLREGRKLWRERHRYFCQFWNWMELGTLLGSLTAIVMYAGRYVLTEVAMSKVKALRGKYYNFQRLSQWDELFSYLLAFVCFLSILKMVHLLRFNRRISMLGCTLKRAAKDLTSFLVVFFFVFVAFFISGYILFGSQLPQYSKMVTSVETLLSVCLGQAQFKVLEEANRVLGPAYFFFYMLFVVFILLNMFLSILNETFAAVRHDLSQQSNDYEIVDFMLKNLRNWVGKNPFQFLKGQQDKYSKGKRPTEGTAEGDPDLDDPDSYEPMSILQLMLQHIETEFDHLGDREERMNLRTPSGFDSLDQAFGHRPLRLRPGYSGLDGVLNGLPRFDDFVDFKDDDDGDFIDDDDVEIFKY